MLATCLLAATLSAPAAAPADDKPAASAAGQDATPAPEEAGGEPGDIIDMTYIGFQTLPDMARVFVRTSDPVKYTVDNSTPGLIVLVLENAQVPVFNNTRPLPAEYFNGPVLNIEAKPVEAPATGVRVEIRTRSKYATYKHSQKDRQVNVDFGAK